LKRFPLDGAILFSDILIVPYAIGQDLWFEAGEGPRLAPRMSEVRIRDLKPRMERLAPIYETCGWSKANCRRAQLSWALPAARGRWRPT
jgi:uroporphyrinogen decarboxylase